VTIAATDTLAPPLNGIPFIQMIFNVFPMSAVILFVVLSRLIQESYRILQKQAEYLRAQWSLLPSDTIVFKLQQWKCVHIKIYESVEFISSSFALILLLEITYIAISLVANIFFITTNQFSDLPAGLQLNLTVVFIKNVINVIIICRASENIKKEVEC
jgi:hypothetical protein